MCLLTWPLSGSDVGVDLVLMQNPPACLLVNHVVLVFKGLVTKHTALKRAIGMIGLIGLLLLQNYCCPALLVLLLLLLLLLLLMVTLSWLGCFKRWHHIYLLLI